MNVIDTLGWMLTCCLMQNGRVMLVLTTLLLNNCDQLRQGKMSCHLKGLFHNKVFILLHFVNEYLWRLGHLHVMVDPNVVKIGCEKTTKNIIVTSNSFTLIFFLNYIYLT
jgi:hypothetical protein